MTRKEAINEINKVFTPAYANYIVTTLTEGATVSDKEPTTKNDITGTIKGREMNNYKYLNGLSKEAKQTIISKINSGEVNLYHSIMAVLEGRRKRGELQNREAERKYYIDYSGRLTNINDIKKHIFNEIFNYTFRKFISKNRERISIAHNQRILTESKCIKCQKGIS